MVKQIKEEKVPPDDFQKSPPSERTMDDQVDQELWINLHPNEPLTSLGFTHFESIKEYLMQSDQYIKVLNLKGLDLDDNQLEQLANLCPNLTHLLIDSLNVTDAFFAHLQNKKLVNIDIVGCQNLTDSAIENLRKTSSILITSLQSSVIDQESDPPKNPPKTDCENEALIKDEKDDALKVPPKDGDDVDCQMDAALEHLKGMPLMSFDFSGCSQLTDLALEHLKGMPLMSFDFSGCSQLTDLALEHLKGMPLMSIDFSGCSQLTDQALEHLQQDILPANPNARADEEPVDANEKNGDQQIYDDLYDDLYD